ncbi:MAG: N-acetyltransferase [Acidimicrobiales bacterium]
MGDEGGAVTIRQETAGDASPIAKVVAAAFGSPAEARLVEMIRGSAGYVPKLALVAERDGKIVGHVMISHARLDRGGDERRIAMLSPLAVAPDRQRQGVGSALVRAAVALADERGEPLVVLEGSPAYYGRLGFVPSARHGIELPLPSWAPPEAAQVMRLKRYDPALTGRVVYPPAFNDVAEH